jgi:hypothetical protein
VPDSSGIAVCFCFDTTLAEFPGIAAVLYIWQCLSEKWMG